MGKKRFEFWKSADIRKKFLPWVTLAVSTCTLLKTPVRLYSALSGTLIFTLLVPGSSLALFRLWVVRITKVLVYLKEHVRNSWLMGAFAATPRRFLKWPEKPKSGVKFSWFFMLFIFCAVLMRFSGKVSPSKYWSWGTVFTSVKFTRRPQARLKIMRPKILSVNNFKLKF